jgi:hypothetical protein
MTIACTQGPRDDADGKTWSSPTPGCFKRNAASPLSSPRPFCTLTVSPRQFWTCTDARVFRRRAKMRISVIET